MLVLTTVPGSLILSNILAFCLVIHPYLVLIGIDHPQLLCGDLIDIVQIDGRIDPGLQGVIVRLLFNGRLQGLDVVEPGGDGGLEL